MVVSVEMKSRCVCVCSHGERVDITKLSSVTKQIRYSVTHIQDITAVDQGNKYFT